MGQIEALPAVISQRKTIDELKANLLDASNLFLQGQKELTHEEYDWRTIIGRELIVA